MTENKDLLKTIKGTETWKSWSRRYQAQITGRGVEPYKSAQAVLFPIPPDTLSSLHNDLHTGEDTKPISALEEELKEREIEVIPERCSAFGSGAVIQIFRKR